MSLNSEEIRQRAYVVKDIPALASTIKAGEWVWAKRYGDDVCTVYHGPFDSAVVGVPLKYLAIDPEPLTGSKPADSQTIRNLTTTLRALAEGYFVKPTIAGPFDRYIVVENPEYQPDNGENPNLVVDTYEVIPALKALTGSEGDGERDEAYEAVIFRMAATNGDLRDTLAQVRAENERLREEVATWKGRYEAERTDHEAALRDLAAQTDCQRT